MNGTDGPRRARDGMFSGDEHLRRELQATIGALRDLGPRYEPELTDAFMSRLRPLIDGRIAQRFARERPAAVERPRLRSLALGAAAVAAAFLIALPGVGAVIAGPPHGRFAAHHGFMRMHETMLHNQHYGNGAELPDQQLPQPVQPVYP